MQLWLLQNRIKIQETKINTTVDYLHKAVTCLFKLRCQLTWHAIHWHMGRPGLERPPLIFLQNRVGYESLLFPLRTNLYPIHIHHQTHRLATRWPAIHPNQVKSGQMPTPMGNKENIILFFCFSLLIEENQVKILTKTSLHSTNTEEISSEHVKLLWEILLFHLSLH